MTRVIPVSSLSRDATVAISEYDLSVSSGQLGGTSLRLEGAGGGGGCLGRGKGKEGDEEEEEDEKKNRGKGVGG